MFVTEGSGLILEYMLSHDVIYMLFHSMFLPFGSPDLNTWRSYQYELRTLESTSASISPLHHGL
jgi:hypothetical protein